MEVDYPDNPEDNSGSAPDSKSKGKRRLYVGSQALGFRRDLMEVSLQVYIELPCDAISLSLSSKILRYLGQVLSPIKDGMVVDWDIVENIWDHAFR